jgi:hypothetical protein
MYAEAVGTRKPDLVQGRRSHRHSTLGYLSLVEFEQRAAQSPSSVH